MAEWNLLDVVNSVFLKFPAVLKFPTDDLQFPVIVFLFIKHSNVNFNYNNYYLHGTIIVRIIDPCYLLIINYYYNHMAQWNLFDVVNSVHLKFCADDLYFLAVVFSF